MSDTSVTVNIIATNRGLATFPDTPAAEEWLEEPDFDLVHWISSSMESQIVGPDTPPAASPPGPVTLDDNGEQWIELPDGTSISVHLTTSAVRINFWDAQQQCVTTNIFSRPITP